MQDALIITGTWLYTLETGYSILAQWRATT